MVFLGIADLISALLLVRGFYPIDIPEVIVYLFSAYLIIKGLIFIKDIGSIIDIIGGILLAASVSFLLFQPPLMLFSLLIGLKGALSVMGGTIQKI